MNLVEDDGVDAGQLRVALEAAQEEPGGDDLDPGGRAGTSLTAHREADGVTDLLAQQVRQVAGGRAGGDAPRLGDDDAARPSPWALAVRCPGGGPRGGALGEDIGQERWDERRLAGAGWCGEHQAGADAVGTGGVGGETLAQLGQHLDHRKIRGRGEQGPDGVGWSSHTDIFFTDCAQPRHL